MNGILCEIVDLKLMNNLQMKENRGYIEDIEKILVSANDDFVPNLYDRIEYDGILEEKVSFRISERLKEGYQYILALDKSDKVVGFTEVQEKVDSVNGVNLTSINVGTSAIRKDFQGKGIAKLLYSYLDNLAILLDVDMVVRSTWSSNFRQLALYERFGYVEIARLENSRGEGIHSLKFCKMFKTNIYN